MQDWKINSSGLQIDLSHIFNMRMLIISMLITIYMNYHESFIAALYGFYSTYEIFSTPIFLTLILQNIFLYSITNPLSSFILSIQVRVAGTVAIGSDFFFLKA